MSRRVKGFSLVELMIAVLLGMVVTLAATQMFSVNQRSFQLQQAMTDVQEQGQLTLRFLVEDIRMAGFYEDGVSGEVGVIRSGTQASANAAHGDNDRLTIAYHGVQDCEGSGSATAVQVVNSYWVEDGELRCNGNLTGGAGVALIDNVESFQVLYGLRAAGTPPRAEQYVPAGEIGGGQVIAIKVAFMLKNDNAGVGVAGSGLGVVLLDEVVETEQDNAIRRTFQRTVALRNFDWDAL